MRSIHRRWRALTLSILAGTLVGGALVVTGLAPVGAEPDWPDEFGPCLPGNCPDKWDPSHTGDDKGYRDRAINVFVGRDMSVVEAAAEMEGRVVVMGNFDQNKSPDASGAYNIGVVGAGSQVRPPENSVAFAVGGNITVASGQRTLLDGDPRVPLKVRYGGSLSGTVIADDVKQDSSAVAAYSGVVARLQAISNCINTTATTAATGTARNTGSEVVFTGDGTSQLQVFDVDFDIASASGGAVGITLNNIPSGASMIVNMRGASRLIRTYTGGHGGPLDDQSVRLLWNFPQAADVNLVGATQFQGSVLVAQPASTTRMAYSGSNGRVYVNGSLIHGGGGLRGQEFHSYPYLGLLPTCTTLVTTTTTSTITTTTTTSTTSSSTTSSSTTTTAPSSTTTTHHHHRPDDHDGELASTGAPVLVLAVVGLGALGVGAAALLGSRRRRPQA